MQAAKSKWDKLEHYISSVVMRKQTISHMEAEMDLHINKREELSKKIENYSKRFDEAINKDQVRIVFSFVNTKSHDKLKPVKSLILIVSIAILVYWFKWINGIEHLKNKKCAEFRFTL